MALLIVSSALLWLAPLPASAQRPPLVVPRDGGTEIGRLPPGYARLGPTSPRTSPASGSGPAIEQVRQLLATAARTGDARLATRADALLAAIPRNDRRPAVLLARAFAAQHRHDFANAVAWLDRLIEARPRDGSARLSRAQVNLVRGRLDLARSDCVALALGIDSGSGLLCAAALALRRAENAQAAGLAERWLAQAPEDDTSMAYAMVLRAEAASRARDADADTWFRRALARDPGDVRTLAAYARHLRGAGHGTEVERLLAARTDSDGLQLQRALAAHAAEARDARLLADAQAERYRIAHAAGVAPELRDEAEFLLVLRGQPGKALELALANFQLQRDAEDVDILLRSARAAGRPEAAAPLRAWAAEQRVPLPPPSAGAPR